MSSIITLTGPSGIGKGYVKEHLRAAYPFVEPKVITTREPRESVELSDRCFICDEEFQKRLAAGELILVQEIHNKMYGFEKSAFECDGYVLTELHIDNVEAFRTQFPDAYMIGLTTDSQNLLHNRLKLRGETQTEQALRLKNAVQELSQMASIQQTFDLWYSVNFKNESRVVPDILKCVTEECGVCIA
jgi:guanylate kinase